ncbi:MAG TPA: ribosomal L7Ae/L30e/S12e/Gadd45 family protein [Gemmatimonadota bacterium]|nr:ribosomal L7Ae/L30e/S12e/Gadd45 family protein [Gemmatimonadota bacterium]
MGESVRKARVSGLVRQARRAGRLVVGVALTREAVRQGRATVVLVADDLSSGRRDRLLDRGREAGVPVSRGWSKDELGELAGKNAVAVLAVTDPHMAAGIVAIEAAARAERESKDPEREE